MSVVIRAVGSALPARAVPNDDLPAALETSDEWIKSRTGIAQRYIAADDETTSSLAIAAARSALDSAGLKADDIDGIIGSSLSDVDETSSGFLANSFCCFWGRLRRGITSS